MLAREFLPQLDEDRRWARDVDVKLALALFVIGFVKKSCVADNVAPLADAVFAAPGLVGYALGSAPKREDVGFLKWKALTTGADVAASKVVKTNIEGMARWAARR